MLGSGVMVMMKSCLTHFDAHLSLLAGDTSGADPATQCARSGGGAAGAGGAGATRSPAGRCARAARVPDADGRRPTDFVHCPPPTTMSVSALNALAQCEGWELQLDVATRQPSFVVMMTVGDRTYERASDSVKAARKLAAAAAYLDLTNLEAADPVSRLFEWMQAARRDAPTFAPPREVPRVF